jgi:hypothetical protein
MKRQLPSVCSQSGSSPDVDHKGPLNVCSRIFEQDVVQKFLFVEIMFLLKPKNFKTTWHHKPSVQS